MVQSIVLTGPTAVGKTSLALQIARTLGLEIVNADTVCFYRHFDIGSAKPSELEQNEIPHHLIDVADPLENYHAGRFLSDCKKALAEIHSRGKRALIVGGSGFYLKVLRYGMWDAPAGSPEFRAELQGVPLEELFLRLQAQDPVHAQKIGANDRYRLVRALEILALSEKKPSELESGMSRTPDPAFRLFVVDREKTALEERMLVRIRAMLDRGWIEETRVLREKFPGSRILRSVGYAQILDHLDGVKPQGRKLRPGTAGLIDEITLAHHQLAKQQRTWFKSLEPDAIFTLDRDEAVIQEKILKTYQ